MVENGFYGSHSSFFPGSKKFSRSLSLRLVWCAGFVLVASGFKHASKPAGRIVRFGAVMVQENMVVAEVAENSAP